MTNVLLYRVPFSRALVYGGVTLCAAIDILRIAFA